MKEHPTDVNSLLDDCLQELHLELVGIFYVSSVQYFIFVGGMKNIPQMLTPCSQGFYKAR